MDESNHPLFDNGNPGQNIVHRKTHSKANEDDRRNGKNTWKRSCIKAYPRKFMQEKHVHKINTERCFGYIGYNLLHSIPDSRFPGAA